MTDFANLVLGVDATSVNEGAEALDRLSAAGARASGQAQNTANSTRATGMAAAAMARDAQSATVAAIATTTGMTRMGTASGLAAHHMTNLSFQINDVVSGLAMGQRPMQVFLQQGGQLFQISQQAGLGLRGLAVEALKMVGVLRTVQDAELAEEAANAAGAAAAIKGASDRAKANVLAADTQLALAEANVASATTSQQLTAAQAELAGAHAAVAAAARGAEVAEIALAQAQARAAAAGEASASASYTSLTKMGGALTALTVAAGLAYGGFKAFQMVVADSGVLNDYAEKLRLTDEQIRKAGGSVKYLADGTRQVTGLSVTMGDAVRGVWKTIADHAGLDNSLEGLKKFFIDQFRQMLDAAIDIYAELYGDIVGTYRAIIVIWQNFPKAIGDIFVQGVNAAINAINSLLQASVSGVNGFLDKVNSILPEKLQLDHLAGVQIDNIENSYAGAAAKVGNALSTEVARATQEARAQGEAIKAEVEKNILDAAKTSLQDQSDSNKPKAPPKPKKENDHGLSDALAELDAQIRGQERLAAAYLETDSAVIRAEALQKAEEQAIRHKGDVALFYEKELQLAIANRITDGAKIVSDNRAQETALRVVNDLVEQGIVPVQRMSQVLDEHSKKRQLFAALEAAQFAGNTAQAEKRISLIADLDKSQRDLNAELATEATLRAKGQKDDEIRKLELETELLGASNKERAIRLAQLDVENYIRDKGIKDPKEQATVTKSYVDAATAANTLTEAQNNYNLSLNQTLTMLNLMVEQTQEVGTLLGDAFGQAGNAIGGMLSSLANWQAQEQAIADWKREETKKAGTDAVALANIEAQAQQKSKNAQIGAVTSLLGATKSLFKEHSAGYKAMEAAEKAFAIVQAISTIKSVAAGAAKMFSQLGVWAFPAVAAMIAVMAGLGFAGASASGTQTPPDIPTSGTGTVLGSPNAQSESIANSLAIMSKNSTKGLDQTADMVSSLRAIRDGIGALTSAVARSLNLSGGFFDTTGKLGTSSSGGFLGTGLFGSTTTKSLYDQGITINGGSLEQILEQGITGSTYQVIESIKKSNGFLGIGGGTKTSYSTSTGALDPAITSQFQLVIENISKSIVDAGKMLGFNVEEALKTFQVQIGQISFKDMSADQIQSTLEAVFSKIADQMAGFAVAGLEKFQQAGEGLYETLMRVAKDFVTVGQALKSIGLVAPASIDAREALIKLAGGLEEFTSQVNFYYENFLTTGEQTAFLQDQVNAAFAAMGVAVPTTIDQFKALVAAQDLTTEAGQAMYSQLMAIAPAFYNLETAAEQAAAAAAAAAAALAKQKTQLQIDLLNAQGKSTEALAMKRQMELAAMDESLRGLQQQVWAAQDLAKAKDNLLTAYKRESQELQATIDKFRGFAKDLRAFRDSLFDTADPAQAYQRSLVELIKQTNLAKAGNEDALGGGLASAAQTFLENATAQATSLQDVARARALVLQSVDSAIGVADSKASVAQKQLDAMTAQVSKLVDINDSVLSVKDAILAVKALMPKPATPAPVPTPGTPGSGTGIPRPPIIGGWGGRGDRIGSILDRIHDRLGDVQAATEQTAVSANRTARVLRNSDRGGGLAVVTDTDAPLETTGVDGGSA